MEDEPLTREQTLRLTAAARRALRVRREIILLAGHASEHLPGARRACRKCGSAWPCAPTMKAARLALDAVADLRE